MMGYLAGTSRVGDDAPFLWVTMLRYELSGRKCRERRVDCTMHFVHFALSRDKEVKG